MRGAGNREILANQPDKDLERLLVQPYGLSHTSSTHLSGTESKSQASGWVFQCPGKLALGLHFNSTSVVKVLLPAVPVLDALRSLSAEALRGVWSPGDHAQGFGGPVMAVAVLSCLQPTWCLIPQPAGRWWGLVVMPSSKLTLGYEDV